MALLARAHSGKLGDHEPRSIGFRGIGARTQCALLYHLLRALVLIPKVEESYAEVSIREDLLRAL